MTKAMLALRNRLVEGRNRASAALEVVKVESRQPRVRGNEQLIEDFLVRIVRLDQTVMVLDDVVKEIDRG